MLLRVAVDAVGAVALQVRVVVELRLVLRVFALFCMAEPLTSIMCEFYCRATDWKPGGMLAVG